MCLFETGSLREEKTIEYAAKSAVRETTRFELRVQVLHMATALMLMKRKSLPPKEVFIRLLKLNVKCAVPNELINDFIDAFEVAGSKRPSFADMETPPSKIKSDTKDKNTSPTRKAKVIDDLSSDSSDSEKNSWPLARCYYRGQTSESSSPS